MAKKREAKMRTWTLMITVETTATKAALRKLNIANVVRAQTGARTVQPEQPRVDLVS